MNMQHPGPSTLAIITGCSKGIGKELTAKFLQTGDAEVIGISRTPVKAQNYFSHIQVDLSDWRELAGKLDSIFPDARSYEKIVLVNNAAWIGDLKHIGNLATASIATAFAINSIAPAMMMNAFVKKYEQVPAEKLVLNISTSAGRYPRDGMSNYCSTKAALDMLTKVAHQEAEIRKSGVKYYIVSVGATDTSMQDDIRTATEDNFTTIQRFVDLKKNNGLLSAEEVADRILQLIQHPIHTEDGYIYIKK